MSPGLLVEQALEDADTWRCLNAFITLTAERARRQAQESLARYTKGTRTRCELEQRPLDGVTIAIKDNFCTKQIATTCASKCVSRIIV